MKFEWCVTEDWENPAKGEEWHDAESYDAATAAFYARMGPFPAWVLFRFIQRENGVVIDFGSHRRFGLVRQKEDGCEQ